MTEVPLNGSAMTMLQFILARGIVEVGRQHHTPSTLGLVHVDTAMMLS